MKSLNEQNIQVSKALVFDIKRFAVHDGYGIRTTVFFKGCPLRCRWCQNPEGLSSKRNLIYFRNKCIHCHRCKAYAKEGQIIYKNDRPYFNNEYQGDFDNLVDICPTQAIRYDSEEYDIETLLEKIKEDQVFFRESGGVTFSGGEPLMQGEFLYEILKLCRQYKIHTAIETSGYGSFALIQKILPYLNLIYIDLKIFDEKKHLESTGISSAIIKKHIQYILKSPYKNNVIIRTPLIPKLTATDENIKNIARFLVDIDSDVQYELLNYNPLAYSKYELVDLTYGVDQSYKMYTKQQMEHFYHLAYQSGIKNLIKE